MSAKPLPPPPKMSGLTTPANATSSVFTTPSGSSHITSRYNYPTPAAGAGIAATSKLATGTGAAARGASASLPSTKVAAPPPPQQQHSVSYETFAPRTAESRYRLARLAALTAGPCFGDSHVGPQSEQKVKLVEDGSSNNDNSNSTTSTAVTLAEAMRPPKASTMKSVHSRNNGNSASTTTTSNVDDIIHKTLESTLFTTTKLTSLIQHTSSLRIALHTSLTIANDVAQRHSDLLKHSGELSAAAERLQHEEQILTRRATEVGLPLKHYDAVDRLGVLVGVLFKDGGRVIVRTNAKLHVDNNVDEFMEVLEQIDDAIEFFGESSGGSGGADNRRRERLAKKDQGYESTSSGSAEYYRRACALQDAALELLRVGVADRITQTRTQIQDALNLPRVPISADKLEASLVYTRFHGISKRSNALISIARKRLDELGNQSVAATSYEDLLTLCRNTYCGAREVLLTSTVRTHMDILRDRHGLVGMTRLASVFLIRLCTIETAMYLDFFGDAEKRRYSQKKTKGALDAVDEEKSDNDAVADGEGKEAGDESENSGNISQSFQRKGSSSSHPGAAALASQIISEDATFRDAEFQSMLGALCSALHRTIRRGLVSVLDLDVLCQVVSVLREERSAANSSPTLLAAARAVSGVIQDAQERLIFCANDALHKEVARFKPTTNDLNYPGKLLGEKPKVAIIIDDESNAPAVAETTESKPDAAGDVANLGPIDDALAAQQRVYDSWFPPMRSVLRILSKIFRVVEPRVFEDIALQSVQSCTKSLKDGSIYILKKSGQIHADLFLVKHLLILREQLSPFDIQLRSVERQLDFSEAGKAVTRFLANRNRRLFSMSTENALITLLREGVSVQESSVDSKRDLEDCLRSACNDFIENTSSSILGPIAGFVDQCKNAAGSTSTTGSADLINAPFMNGTVVNSLVSTALQSLDGELDNVTKQMTLYLENTATQGILLKPVVRKVTRSLEEVKRFIGEVPNEENGWDANVRTEVLKYVEDFETKVKSKK